MMLPPLVKTLQSIGRCYWLLVLLVVFSGCASNGYLTVRRVPRNPLEAPLQLLSRKGPRPTDRTQQLLRQFDLSELQSLRPDEVLERLQSEIATEPTADKIHSYAELAYIEGRKSEMRGDPSDALDMYGAAVAHAYLYLFDPRYDSLRNPYDPQFRRACDLYNGALESALRIVNDRGGLRPGTTLRVATGTQHYEVRVEVRGPWHTDDFAHLEFASDYEVVGLKNRHHTYGLGVPLIAVRRGHPQEDPAEQFYPPGLSFPVTAFLRVMPGRGDTAAGVHTCVLELYDPVASNKIQVAGRVVPLETDLSTPLAYFLDNPAFKQNSSNIATWGLLNPNSTAALTGLYMLEPYDPGKIPVLMVHGLWSSPLTWMEMFNDLRSFPEIRDHYQFWFYLYPTGQPFWISAAQMREDLLRARATLDPRNATPALNYMVLVGHSMGGLVSRMQTLESGNDFWNIVSDRPFAELKTSDEERAELASALFFKPNPWIRRVITLGTPHRGSDFANDYTRWLGRKLITLPTMVEQLATRVTRRNPDFFRDTHLLTTTTSIDSLAPDSPILPVILKSAKPPWVTYHNVVGLVPETGILGRFSAGSDGIVSYASAHLDEAASEIIVQADHISVHQHPRSVLEVRRILRENLDIAIAEAAGRRTLLPASYPQASQLVPHASHP